MATLSVPPTEQREQPLRATAFGGVFGWGAVLLLLVGILAYVFIVWGGVDHFSDADAARVLERQKILQDRVTEDYKYLHDKPGYFKKDAGLVRVPIDEAMRMTLSELQKIKPHAAYPIAQSPPQNSSAPTSPDKGPSPGAPVAGKTNDNAPAASNPTVGQPTPAPTAAPAAANNASNPGNPPPPGTQAQPSAPPMETNTSGVVTPAPAAPAPSASVAPATPAVPAPPASPAATPTPNPPEPGASPAGTP